jgi:hypothetical protein
MKGKRRFLILLIAFLAMAVWWGLPIIPGSTACGGLNRAASVCANYRNALFADSLDARYRAGVTNGPIICNADNVSDLTQNYLLDEAARAERRWQAKYLIGTGDVHEADSNADIVIVFTRPYRRDTRPWIFKGEPRHDVGSLSGSADTISTQEFAQLDVSTFVDVRNAFSK